MKPEQLEILIFTDTRFSSNQFCEKSNPADQNNFGSYKNLEEACWNGLFRELLPELYGKLQDLKKLTLWKVIREAHFLDLVYGEQPEARDRLFSANPHFFLDLQLLS